MNRKRKMWYYYYYTSYTCYSFQILEKICVFTINGKWNILPNRSKNNNWKEMGNNLKGMELIPFSFPYKLSK